MQLETNNWVSERAWDTGKSSLHISLLRPLGYLALSWRLPTNPSSHTVGATFLPSLTPAPNLALIAPLPSTYPAVL